MICEDCIHYDGDNNMCLFIDSPNYLLIVTPDDGCTAEQQEEE